MDYLFTLGIILILLLVSTKSAHAYLDPGSGSYLLQLLIGGIIAVIFTIKAKWKRIKELIKKKKQIDAE